MVDIATANKIRELFKQPETVERNAQINALARGGAVSSNQQSSSKAPVQTPPSGFVSPLASQKKGFYGEVVSGEGITPVQPSEQPVGVKEPQVIQTSVSPIGETKKPALPRQEQGPGILEAGAGVAKKFWYGNEKGPEQLAQSPDAIFIQQPSVRSIMAESFVNVGMGLSIGGVTRVAAPAAAKATGLLKTVYKGSKIGMGGSMAVGMGADIGKTVHDVRTGALGGPMLAHKSLQTGLGFLSFAYGAGGKGLFVEQRYPIGETYRGFVKTSKYPKITEISNKPFTDSMIKNTMLQEPYEESFLIKQYDSPMHLKDTGMTRGEYVKRYIGRTPEELILNAKELQTRVRFGASWIENKAIMGDTALKNLIIEGKNKKKLMRLDSFERMPKIEEGKLINPEFSIMEFPGTKLKVSKPFEFIGENKMPSGIKTPIEQLMAKTGIKKTGLLGLPDKETISIKSSSKSSGFQSMDELGGFKKMYGKKTVMLLEEEPEMISRRWSDKFRTKPERTPTRMNYSGKSFDMTMIQGLNLGSLFGHKTYHMQVENQMIAQPQININTDIQRNIQHERQINLQHEESIQRQFNRNLNLNVSSNITGQKSIQGTRTLQLQRQLLKQETITKTVKKIVTIPQSGIMKTKIPIIPSFPGDDPFLVRTKPHKRKKSFESRMNIFELQIPTLKDLWGG